MTTDWSRPSPPKSVSLDLYAAVLLGIAALLTAWAAYKGGVAGGTASANYTNSTQLLSDANFFFSQGNSQLDLDQQYFIQYTVARTDGNERLAAEIHSLMSPNLVAGIDFWEANGRQGSPFDTIEDDANPYEVEGWVDGNETQEEYDEVYAAGQNADKVSDRYQRSTVLFALALFFSGVGSLLKQPAVGVGALGVSAVAIVGGLALMLV